MADGIFGDQSFLQLMQDPQLQYWLSLASQPNRGPRGERIGLGQQLQAANQQTMALQQAAQAQRMQQAQMQQAERKAKAEEKQLAALEAFRERSAEYTDEAGAIKPKAALNLAVKLGVADPMEAIGAAVKMKRYQPVGGNMVLDTETDQFIQAPPPEFMKIPQGTMLGQRTEGGYEPVLINPKTFPPPRGGGGTPRQPRMVVVPDPDSPTGYAWQPATAGQTATPPGGKTGGGLAKGALTPQAAGTATKLIEGMQRDIVAGEGVVSGVVGPKGMVNRWMETGRGLIPGQQFAPTPALDFDAKKEINIAILRKTINPDPNWTKADRQNFMRLMGEYETAGTAGSAARALEGLKSFINSMQVQGGAAKGGTAARTVVRRGKQKSTGKTVIEYSDGTREIID